MNESHRRKISKGQRKSWQKGGPSRLAYEKRRRASKKRRP